MPAETCEAKPRPSIVNANVPWTSSQARTQREQHDALGGVELEVGVRPVLGFEEIVFGAILAPGENVVLAIVAVTDFAQADGSRHVLQLTVAVGAAGQAIERVVGDVKLHHAATEIGEAGILRRDLDAGCNRRRARRRRASAAFDLAKAEAAGAPRIEAVGGAELRDLDAELHRGIHDRGALGDRDLAAVDLERHQLGGFVKLRSGRAEIRLFDEVHRLNVVIHRASSLRSADPGISLCGIC